MAIKHKIRSDDKGGFKVVSLSARKAIVAHCKECMGFNSAEVRRCTSPNCALFPFRTWDTPEDNA